MLRSGHSVLQCVTTVHVALKGELWRTEAFGDGEGLDGHTPKLIVLPLCKGVSIGLGLRSLVAVSLVGREKCSGGAMMEEGHGGAGCILCHERQQRPVTREVAAILLFSPLAYARTVSTIRVCGPAPAR